MPAAYIQGGTLHRVRCNAPLTRATSRVAVKVTLCSANQHAAGCDRCAGKRHTNKTARCSASFSLRSPIKAASSHTLHELETGRRVLGLWRLEVDNDVVDPRLLARAGILVRVR